MATNGPALTYRIGNDLALTEVIDLYRASTLGERRPVDDEVAMTDMLRNANLVISTWDGSQLVGIARSLTDFAYVAYLSDLAVRQSHQRQGIGKELIRRTQAAIGPKASVVLLAAPAAQGYYGPIGMTQHPSAWVLRPGQKLVD